MISSVETKNEFGTFIKFAKYTKLINFVPKQLLKLPRKLAHFLFGADNKKLLNAILDDTDLSFTKWATRELINWKNGTKLKNCLKISGENDKLLPQKDNNAILIPKGEHFMIVDKAKEISEIINSEYSLIFDLEFREK